MQTELVSVRHTDGVALVTLNNPPVNALGLSLRGALHSALVTLRDDSAVKAIVIACAGRTFVSGADITELGTPLAAAAPSLHDLCATLETIDKPVVAALHGTALGGGLELAMACHYRIADHGTKLGLPEVKLGLMPGAGGTVRLPRLVGATTALQMVVSGKPLNAAEARTTGLIDDVAFGNLAEAVVGFAKEKAGAGGPHQHTRYRDSHIVAARLDLAGIDEAIKEATRRANGLDAPHYCAAAIRNAVTQDFDTALKLEAELFSRLEAGEQARAQRHIFFAEREAAKVPGLPKDMTARAIERVGVVGAGTMGGGIAMAFANGGFPVVIVDTTDEAIERGLATIARNYNISVARGSLSEEDRTRRLNLISRTTNYADLAECDLIVEAVFEDMNVKLDVFSKLDAIARPGTILATNTSYLDINVIAAATSRPSDVVGLHFFSPANVMRLLEIVRGAKTSQDVILTALSLAKRIGKAPVVVGVCHGFVGNRMLEARSAHTEHLLLEGASPEQIDKAFVDFGWPMGPLQMFDMAGLDVGWRNRKSLGRTEIVGDTLCERGRFGQKSGKGYYLYREGTRTPVSDPEVTQLIEEAAQALGIERREIHPSEIIERSVFPMINEGVRIIDEKITARASDVDVVWVTGYGFPIGKGGPMFFADNIGLKHIVDRLEHWHEKTGTGAFEPAPLLRRLAIEGGRILDATSSV